MAKTPHRIGTRTTNSSIHPGDLVNATTRKRRTKAQIAADNAAKAAQEAAKKKVTKDNLERVAVLEKSIAEEDANESTPRPRRPCPRRAAPSQTTVKIPLYADESDQGDNDDLGDTTADEYKPQTDAASESALESQPGGDDADSEDLVTEDQPPKKKQKKLAVRDEIKKINDKAAASGGDDSESSGGKRAADKGPNKAISGPGSKASTCVIISHVS